MKWQARDIVAILVLLLAGSLLHRGIDTTVGWTLIVIVAGYFGISIPSLVKIIRQVPEKKEKEIKDND